MGFGKGALLWLICVPLPIILLVALFMHHVGIKQCCRATR